VGVCEWVNGGVGGGGGGGGRGWGGGGGGGCGGEEEGVGGGAWGKMRGEGWSLRRHFRWMSDTANFYILRVNLFLGLGNMQIFCQVCTGKDVIA